MPKGMGYPPKKKVEYGGGSGRSGMVCGIPPKRTNASHPKPIRRTSSSSGRNSKTNRR